MTKPTRAAYYERMMSAERDAPRGASGAALRYCIASTPRSGSTLLGRTLEASGHAGVPMEYLNPEFIAGWSRLNPGRRIELRQYMGELESRRTTPNGVFGLKAHWAQLHRLAAEARRPVAELAEAVLGRHTKFILINRRDKLAQAVSLHIANQTKVYHSDQVELRAAEPTFDAVAISAHIARLFSEEADWRSYVKARGVESIEVIYEDLVADHAGVCRKVLDFLGQDGVPVPPPPTQKLGEKAGADFRRQYLGQLGA